MVASYPYDDSIKHQRQGFYSATPDDDFYIHVAKIYSDNHPIMHLEQPCNGDTFEGGITNGADWYDVPGGNYKSYHNARRCFRMEGALHTDLQKSETNRDIKK